MLWRQINVVLTSCASVLWMHLTSYLSTDTVAEKAVWRSVFLCIWHCILSADSTKMHSFIVTFLGFFFSGWDIYKSMFFGVCWELFNHWGGKCLIIVLYYFKKLIKNIIENIFCLACLNRHLNIFVDVWVWKLADCLQPHEICLRLVFIVLHHLNRIGLSFRRNSSGDRRGRESHVDYHLSRSTLIESYLHIHWDLVAQNRRMQ